MPPDSNGWIATTLGRSVVSFLRKGRDPSDTTLFVCNFTPVPRHNYRVGAPAGGHWREVLNSDAPLYGGSGQGNVGGGRGIAFAAFTGGRILAESDASSAGHRGVSARRSDAMKSQDCASDPALVQRRRAL